MQHMLLMQAKNFAWASMDASAEALGAGQRMAGKGKGMGGGNIQTL